MSAPRGRAFDERRPGADRAESGGRVSASAVLALRLYAEFCSSLDLYEEVEVFCIAVWRVRRVLSWAITDGRWFSCTPIARRLLSACGLEFEEGCLRFFENARAVLTPSSEQVRRPVNRGGLDSWQPYEQWLAPLKDALGPVLDMYPNAPPL